MRRNYTRGVANGRQVIRKSQGLRGAFGLPLLLEELLDGRLGVGLPVLNIL